MDTLVIAFAQDPYMVDAVAEVKLDSTVLGNPQVHADHRNGSAQPIAFVGDWGPNEHILTITFTNDAWGGTPESDRNLFVLGVTYNGVYITKEVASLWSTGDTFRLVIPGSIDAKPVWADDFNSDDPGRWINFDGQYWPPRPGQKGKWARMYYYGWPDNSGGQDGSARFLPANKEAQCFEDRGVSVGPDGLVLTATRDSNNHHARPWTSGCVVQNRDAAILYGYMVARIKFDPTPGFWPGWWMLAASLNYPPEIDTMEWVGKNAANDMALGIVRSGVVGGQGFWPSAVLPDQFHDYGVLWTPDAITFFLDGKPTGTQPALANCHEPMYCLLDYAVGGPGSWPGEPADSVNRSTMTVRSVRSYALGSWGSSIIPIT